MLFVFVYLLVNHISDVSCYIETQLPIINNPTQQSSTLPQSGDSGLAVDGVEHTVYQFNSCTHTLQQDQPWWTVDLLSPQLVTRVELLNRGDCCGDRLTNVRVLLSDAPFSSGLATTQCGRHAGVMNTGQWGAITCNQPTKGRYLTVQLEDDNGYLTLCEVKVYARINHVLTRIAAGSGILSSEVQAQYLGGHAVPGIDAYVSTKYFSLDATEKAVLKSPLVQCSWNKLQSMKLSLYKEEQEVMWMEFDRDYIISSDHFFSIEHLQGSNYADLTNIEYSDDCRLRNGSHFGMEDGFSVSCYHESCYDAHGWFVYVDKDYNDRTDQCLLEDDMDQYPILRYSTLNSLQNITEMGTAEILFISADLGDAYGGDCITDCNLVPDGKYHSCYGCDMYAECTSGLLKYYKCSDGLFFNQNTGACEDTATTCLDGVAPDGCLPEEMFYDDIAVYITTEEAEHSLGNDLCRMEAVYKCYLSQNKLDVEMQMIWLNGDTVLKEEIMLFCDQPFRISLSEIQQLTGKITDVELTCMVRQKNFNEYNYGKTRSAYYYVNAQVESTTSLLDLFEGAGSGDYLADIKLPYSCTYLCSENKTCITQLNMRPIMTGSATLLFNELISYYAQTNYISTTYITTASVTTGTHVTTAISPKIDGAYSFTKQVYLKFVAEIRDSFDNILWAGLLPQIVVNVYDGDAALSGKYCQIYNDPHVRSFDGRYFELQKSGFFTLYRHKRLPIEVQAYFESRGRYTSVCGVAVRSGGELYVANFCRARGLLAKFYQCDEEGTLPSLKIERARKEIKITLPTGGKVVVTPWSIFIYATLIDTNNVEGICGVLSDTCTDDLQFRDSDQVDESDNCPCNRYCGRTYPYGFVESWRVSNADSLFFGVIVSTIVTTIQQDIVYCEYSSNGDKYCSSTSTKITTTTTGVDITASSRGSCSRSKRAIVVTDDVDEDEFVFEYDPNYTAPEPEWLNDWTQTKAETHCNDYLSNRDSVKLCVELGVVDLESSIETCVEDIFITGTTDFASVQRDTIISVCLEELGKNETLATLVSDSGTQSVLEELLASVCPGDCSDHGVCTEGACVCEEDYTGDDCSFYKNHIPDVYDFSNEGLCDKSSRPCEAMPVYADLFIESDQLKCAVQVLDANRAAVSDQQIFDGQLEHFQKIFCPIPSNTLPYMLDVTVSNNNADYSDSKYIMIYDSVCWVCSVEGGCTKKQATCVIDGECMEEGVRNAANDDEVCDPDSDEYGWTNDQDNTPYGLIIGLVVGLLILILIVVAVGILIYKTKGKSSARKGPKSAKPQTTTVLPRYLDYSNNGTPPLETQADLKTTNSRPSTSLAFEIYPEVESDPEPEEPVESTSPKSEKSKKKSPKSAKPKKAAVIPRYLDYAKNGGAQKETREGSKNSKSGSASKTRSTPTPQNGTSSAPGITAEKSSSSLKVDVVPYNRVETLYD